MDIEDMVFVVGSGHHGMMTEILLLDKEKVEARDPDGLIPLDTSRVIGLPHQYVRTAEGVRDAGAFMGDGVAARAAFNAIGIEEAPIAWDREAGAFVYVTKDSDVNSRLSPRTRTLVTTEAQDLGVKVTLFHRFPGEEDWMATLESLPEAVANSLPSLENGSFITLHPESVVIDWLKQAKIVAV